jgi:hypothetical protein
MSSPGLGFHKSFTLSAKAQTFVREYRKTTIRTRELIPPGRKKVSIQQCHHGLPSRSGSWGTIRAQILPI